MESIIVWKINVLILTFSKLLHATIGDRVCRKGRFYFLLLTDELRCWSISRDHLFNLYMSDLVGSNVVGCQAIIKNLKAKIAYSQFHTNIAFSENLSKSQEWAHRCRKQVSEEKFESFLHYVLSFFSLVLSVRQWNKCIVAIKLWN